MKLYIHIGLPKCASTFLQSKIFPEICRINNINFFRDNEHLRNKIFKHQLNIMFMNKIEKLKIKTDTLVSWEKLVGYEDPYFWDKYSKKNFEFFGKNSHIIIIIREPKSFLSSIYLEHCIQKQYFPRPDFYFLNNKTYSEELQQKKFSLRYFSYKNLIKSYRKKFKKVSVIKFEDLFNYKTHSKLFNMNKIQENKFKVFFENQKKVNESYSSSMVWFLRNLNKFLGIFDLSLQTKIYRYDYILNQSNQKDNSSKIKRKLKTYFTFRTLIFGFLNKLFYNKKYLIDFKKYRINLSELENEYKKIKTQL